MPALSHRRGRGLELSSEELYRSGLSSKRELSLIRLYFAIVLFKLVYLHTCVKLYNLLTPRGGIFIPSIEIAFLHTEVMKKFVIPVAFSKKELPSH